RHTQHASNDHRPRGSQEEGCHGAADCASDGVTYGEGAAPCSSGCEGVERMPNVLNGQYRSHARPITLLLGTGPNTRESAEFARWSPMTNRSPAGITQVDWSPGLVVVSWPS